MVKTTIVDNTTPIQLEVSYTKEKTIRLYLSDSENSADYLSCQYIDLDKSDTEYLIEQLTELKENFNLEK